MRALSVIVGLLMPITGLATGPQDTLAGHLSNSVRPEASFRADVMPIVKRQCLPCHAEENFNPSELSLDSRDHLLAGGKHGAPVIPGDAGKSILFQKIGPTPPFGDRMPLDPKRKRGQASTKALSEDEMRIFREWIERGAKDN